MTDLSFILNRSGMADQTALIHLRLTEFKQ